MHRITGILRFAAAGLPALLLSAQLGAQTPAAPGAEALAAEIETLKKDYEARLQALEQQLDALKAREEKPAGSKPSAKPAQDNAFNPAIGIVFDGRYASRAGGESIPAFPLGHEAEGAPRGISLGHSEVTASGNVDDKFRAGLTLGLGVHAGEPVELELEEAYVQTLPGSGLGEGVRVKAGRALWTFGYLNEQHAHGDDFADRPLPYRAFLDNAFNDDGVEVSVVLPTELYSEIGGGLFRGDDLPFGGSDNGLRARSAYARLGWDLGRDAAMRVGGYLLDGKASGRMVGDGHAHGEEEDHAHEGEGEEHEEEHEHAEYFNEGMFTGDTRLYGLDFRFTLAPTGNARESELILQGEYFWRREKGTYTLAEEMVHEEEENHEDEEEHADEHPEGLRTDSVARGWYIQGVYKPSAQWRIGARYARLSPPDDAEIDHEPYAFAAMVDWSNSEFGRIRLQYNHEALDGHETNNQIMLQYVMSLGAHAAHSF